YFSVPLSPSGSRDDYCHSHFKHHLGSLGGTFLAIARETKPQWCGRPIALYVSFIRGTPLFIQILLVYLSIPKFGADIPKSIVGIIALSLNAAAYVAEIVRGGLSALQP